MKKLLALLASLILLVGCATVANPVVLSAQYFKTYATKTHYVTEQFYPKEDVFWVAEEKRNGDDVEVAIAWIDEVNKGVGVAFDDLTMDSAYDYCGIMYFESMDDVNKFLNEFDTGVIADGRNVPCGLFLQVLGEEVQRKPVPRKDVVIKLNPNFKIRGYNSWELKTFTQTPRRL